MKQKIEDIMGIEPLSELGLKFVGIGADKAVFETSGSNRKLVKVSMDILRKRIFDMLHDRTPERNERESLQKSRISEQKKYEEDVAEAFGQEHLLRKGVFRAKIPLTKEILLKLVDENEAHLVESLADDEVFNVEMIVETQLVAEELRNREMFKTKSFNTSLITDDGFRNATDVTDALARVRQVVKSNFLRDCDESFEDEKYKTVVKEIVEKIIAYSKKTGRMIDIFGGDNITIFEKEDGSLDYHLLDVILPGSQKAWEENIKDDDGLHLLRHYYTFYYSISTLADKLGISDNLEMEDMVYFKGGEIPTGKFPEVDDLRRHMMKKQ